MEMSLYIFYHLTQYDTYIIGAVAHDAIAALDIVRPHRPTLTANNINTWLIVAPGSEPGIRFIFKIDDPTYSG